MNIFVDECLSKDIAAKLREKNLHFAIHPIEVGMTGATDPKILAYCNQHDHTILTANGKDFRKLCGQPGSIHPGLIIIDGGVQTGIQIQKTLDAIAYISSRSSIKSPPENPHDWIVNKVVENLGGSISDYDLP